MLSLGIPANVVMAVMVGGLMIHGIKVGPLLINEHPDLFWGVIISMYLGNMILLVLNLPLIPMWVTILKIPYQILFPLIIIFCVVGSYGMSNSVADVLIMIFFSACGYLMKKFGFEAAPFVLALVLGPILESALKRSLILEGNPFIFFQRPISVVLMGSAVSLLVASTLLGKKKEMGKNE